MSKFWVKYDEIPALQHGDLRVLHGSVRCVDHVSKRASILPHGDDTNSLNLEYDYLVAATGFRRVWPTVPQALEHTSYLDEAGGHIKAVRDAVHGVAVIGGGKLSTFPQSCDVLTRCRRCGS